MLTITLLSLIVAATSGFIAWRSIRREHLRSSARVASLATAIDDSDLFRSPLDVMRPAERSFQGDFHSEDADVRIDVIDAQTSMRHRLLTVITGAALAVAGVVMIAMVGDLYEPPPQSVAAPHAEPLELLSLQASREGASLAITGMVRSRTEEPITAVTAVVSALDAKGRTIGRGTVPLAAILPRRDSRFVVTLADVGEAARYRVSFRSATGLIRHVDRRAPRAGDVS